MKGCGRYFSILCYAFFAYIGLPENASAQLPRQYTLYFIDKDENSYSLQRPLEFLSQRALDRRARQGLQLTETDLPVSTTYINILREDGVKILFTSAWLNCVTIESTDTLFAEKAVVKYPFLKSARRVAYLGKTMRTNLDNSVNNYTEAFSANDIYGNSFRQVSIHKGQELHRAGLLGQGMQIAVIDAGFWRVDSLQAFAQLRQKNKILGTYDFVEGDNKVYEDNTHGMYVLSVMAGRLEGKLQGTAPEANYYLLRTENAVTELITEEYAWVAAIEWADSAGADVINSSLGYSRFDEPFMNHTYQDMDGSTTPISIAAGMAAEKGMVVVTSAGNAGGGNWYFITAPADAKNVLTVGAINGDLNVARFSSRGPSSDGRVKPDVVAIGVQTVVASATDGETSGANGTSTAAPVIAGLVTCLWQEFPMRTATEVMEAVKASAHLYGSPNDSFGYGIPDFMLARDILLYKTYGSLDYIAQLYPNPFYTGFQLSFYTEEAQQADVFLTDAMGRVLWQRNVQTGQKSYNKVSIDPGKKLPVGLYLVTVKLKNNKLTGKAIRG